MKLSNGGGGDYTFGYLNKIILLMGLNEQLVSVAGLDKGLESRTYFFIIKKYGFFRFKGGVGLHHLLIFHTGFHDKGQSI